MKHLCFSPGLYNNNMLYTLHQKVLFKAQTLKILWLWVFKWTLGKSPGKYPTYIYLRAGFTRPTSLWSITHYLQIISCRFFNILFTSHASDQCVDSLAVHVCSGGEALYTFTCCSASFVLICRSGPFLLLRRTATRDDNIKIKT